jgi:hypothetical protein
MAPRRKRATRYLPLGISAPPAAPPPGAKVDDFEIRPIGSESLVEAAQDRVLVSQGWVMRIVRKFADYIDPDPNNPLAWVIVTGLTLTVDGKEVPHIGIFRATANDANIRKWQRDGGAALVSMGEVFSQYPQFSPPDGFNYLFPAERRYHKQGPYLAVNLGTYETRQVESRPEKGGAAQPTAPQGAATLSAAGSHPSPATGEGLPATDSPGDAGATES